MRTRPATDLISCPACPFHARSIEWAVGIAYCLAKLLSLPGAGMEVSESRTVLAAMSCMIQATLEVEKTTQLCILAFWHSGILSHLLARLLTGWTVGVYMHRQRPGHTRPTRSNDDVMTYLAEMLGRHA